MDYIRASRISFIKTSQALTVCVVMLGTNPIFIKVKSILTTQTVRRVVS